jgi:hypothetical protein
MVGNLTEAGLQGAASRVWLNVETNPIKKCSWTDKTLPANCQLIKDMVASLKSFGFQVGVFSNIYMWNYLMGANNCLDLDPSVAVWYPHDDKLPDLYDFRPFGIWTGPPGPATLKQYKIDSSDCGVSGNINYLKTAFQAEESITSGHQTVS